MSLSIPSGVDDQYIYFIAVDATDFVTRETGLSSFTVVASRNGAADFTYTTPTVTEIDFTTMPGVYALLLDEDMTIASGNDNEEVALHITHAGMAPVTEVYELYRSKITAGNTLSVESDGDATKVNTLDGHTAQTADHTAGIAAIPTTAMRGTDSAALATVCTEPRLAELDAANLPTDIAAIPLTAMRGTDGVDTATMRGTDGANTTKTGYSLSATGLDAIVSTALGMVEIAKAIWDRVLTGATHNIATSAGRRLRGIQDFQGYEGGAIWVDTVNGSAGTIDFENGTVENPVDTWADALTLSASLGFVRFHIVAASTITLTANSDNYDIVGTEWTLVLNGQSIAAACFSGASVSGIGIGADSCFIHCRMGTTTLAQCRMISCALTATTTLSSAATYLWDACYSGVAGIARPTVDFGTAIGNTSLNMRHYSGGVEVENMGDTGTDTMSLEGDGQFVEGTCTGGTVAIRGNFTISGITNLTLSDDARIDVAQINSEADTALVDFFTSSAQLVDDIWDELQSGHVTAGTFGKFLDSEVSGAGGGGDASEAKQDIMIAKVLAYTRLILRSDAAVATDAAVELTAINADEGAGAGDWDQTDASQEALRDNQGSESVWAG